MEKDIRILVVDDHPIVRAGLQDLLETEEDMEVVGLSDGEEVLSQVEKLSPNIVLMDIKMPGVGGVELTRQLKEKFPSCKVIMLTLYDEYLTQAMEAGARGYLLKDIKGEELAQAIRYVQLGEVVISGTIGSTTRIEYEQRRGENDGMFEEIQLVIPAPLDPQQLTRFTGQVEATLQGHVFQVVGSWQEGTAITVSLIQATPLPDILKKLGELSEVEEIVEKLPAKEPLLQLLKKAAVIPRLRTSPRKSIFVTLKKG